MTKGKNSYFAPCEKLLAAGLVGIAVLAFAPIATTNADEVSTSVQVGSGLVLPPMDAVNGKKLYAEKGCVVCHAINGFGGTDAPDIGAATMEPEMNPFDFAAKMWNHAFGMIAMQSEELGQQIEFKNGQELADITAFLHDAEVQKTFGEDDVPEEVLERFHHHHSH